MKIENRQSGHGERERLEMKEQGRRNLRALVVFAEDIGSIPSSYMAAYNRL